MASVSHTCIDNSGEQSVVTFYLQDVDGNNYDDVVGNGNGDDVGELRQALATITLCNFVRHTVTTEVYPELGELPSSPWAQRELKLLVQYIDNVTSKRYTVTIPAPNLAILAQPGTDIVDHVSNLVASSFVTNFETHARSQDGNEVTVLGMRIIGRNV